jgi:DNA-binding NarL/FixJ family response regulator
MADGITVLVVDDHPVVRRGLRTLLHGEAWVGEVLEAATVADSVRQAVTQHVDVVAMDVSLPDGDGIDAVARILAARPEVRIVMLTMADDEEIVARALRAGARGYLVKETDPDTLVDALRTIASGGVVLGPKVGPSVLSTLRRAPADLPSPFDRLSAREREVLAGLAGGESNARIARQLGVSEKTIRNQLSSVFAKLGVADRVQAALLARDAGFSG